MAQALNTTIAGLAIATPAVIAHVYYSRKLERISASMEVLLTELISFRCHHSQR
ncbi:MotA/TolQ/ExbB proton channel family protein [Akkermansia sp.]|uniref:MotA/TolQ/ExbB proton channel family protein n=1 Tax=Akkermansia sp. TaxID=1872421 RepID=UPI003AEFA70A